MPWLVSAKFPTGAGLFIGPNMEWFKHSVGSYDDPHIQEAEDIYGDSAYAFFFKMLEIYAEEWSHHKGGKLDISQRILARKLRKRWTKVELLLNFFQEKRRISYTSAYGRVQFEVPKFKDLASNWTTRKKPPPPEAPTESPTAIEEKRSRREKKRTPLFVPPTPSDVEAYLSELGWHGATGGQFCDYYEARGWSYGHGKKMKDWKAAVRTWKNRGAKKSAQKETQYQERIEV